MITYCTNIHPGETWEDIFRNLQTHFLSVKHAVSPDRPFPIGLRLSAQSAFEVSDEDATCFLEWCREQDCHVQSINGFPYGRFHGTTVKEDVYLPDWRSDERVRYTNKLTDLLSRWLPQGVSGSISTVPLGFACNIGRENLGLVRSNLIAALEHIDLIRQATGKDIVLALEPEPGCHLETADDMTRFYEDLRLSSDLSSCFGCCYDCCHQAVEFEKPVESLRLLSDAGIRLGKVQVSSAVRLEGGATGELASLSEPNYLHQVVVRTKDNRLLRYNDLPLAINDCPSDSLEWRVHFHVPVFADNFGKLGTTRYFLEEILPLIDDDVLLEVETYTWDILPMELQTGTVTESIIREIDWVRTQLYGKNSSS